MRWNLRTCVLGLTLVATAAPVVPLFAQGYGQQPRWGWYQRDRDWERGERDRYPDWYHDAERDREQHRRQFARAYRRGFNEGRQDRKHHRRMSPRPNHLRGPERRAYEHGFYDGYRSL